MNILAFQAGGTGRRRPLNSDPLDGDQRPLAEQLRIFENAVAIVTGGASGIGKAIAEALCARGCNVVLADLDFDLAQQAAAEIRARHGVASARRLDVTSFADVKEAVDDTLKQYGRLDYLFNNAGISAGGELLDHTIEAWRRILEVNLGGVIHGTQAAYPAMVSQGFGHIVNTASMQGLMASPLTASYSTTKHAIVGLSRALRVEAAGRGVRVSVLCPGVIRTPLLQGGRHGIFLHPMPEARQRELSLQLFERLRPMEPTRFARKVLDQLARNRGIIIVPSWWKLLWWVDRASPTLGSFLARRFFESTQERLLRPHR